MSVCAWRAGEDELAQRPLWNNLPSLIRRLFPLALIRRAQKMVKSNYDLADGGVLLCAFSVRRPIIRLFVVRACQRTHFPE